MTDDDRDSAAPPATTATEPLLSCAASTRASAPCTSCSDVDLDVRPGQVTALVGDNGAGKSTLIKGIAGIHAFDAGEYPFEGKPVTRAQPEGRQRPRHRGRLPGPRAVRQPRRRPQHVPRPRAHASAACSTRTPWRRGPRRPSPASRSAPLKSVRTAGRQPLRWPAADRRHRPRGAVELQARHPRRADRRARASPRPSRCCGWSAGWPTAASAVVLISHNLNDVFAGRRRHRGALPRPDGRPGRGQGRHPQPGRRADHRPAAPVDRAGRRATGAADATGRRAGAERADDADQRQEHR